MRFTLFATRLAFTASALGFGTSAMAEPARILFSTGQLPNGGRLQAGERPVGDVVVRGGVTQIESPDGDIVSFVGDAAFNASGDNVRVETGRFTAVAGADNVMAIGLRGDMTVNLSGTLASASFAVDPSGLLTGRPFGGSVTVSSGGTTQTFDIGEAFRAALGNRPAAAVTAGTQPVAAPATVASNGENAVLVGGFDVGQNPSLVNYPTGSAENLLTTLISTRGNADAFTIPTASLALLNANLASVRFGEALGSFDAAQSVTEARALLPSLQGSTNQAAGLSFLDSILRYITEVNAFTSANPGDAAALNDFLAVRTAGLTTNPTTAANIVSIYIESLRGGAAPDTSGFTAEQLQLLANLVRTSTLPATAPAATNAQFEAISAFLASGGTFTPPVVVPPIVTPPVVTPPMVTPPVVTPPVVTPPILSPPPVAAAINQIAQTPGVSSPLSTGNYLSAGVFQESPTSAFSQAFAARAIRFEATGIPIEITQSEARGTKQLVSSASGDEWLLARFGVGRSANPRTGVLNATSSFDIWDVAFLRPITTALPSSGRAEYSLLTHTTPVAVRGQTIASSTFDGRVVINLDAARPAFGIDATLNIIRTGETTAETYRFGSPDQLTSVSGAITRDVDGIAIGSGADVRGPNCTPLCTVALGLRVGGSSGQFLGGGYRVLNNTSPGLTELFFGGVMFQQSNYMAGTPTTPPVVVPPAPNSLARVTNVAGVTSQLTTGPLNGSAGSYNYGSTQIEVSATGAPIDLIPGTLRRGAMQGIESASGAEWVIGRYGNGQAQNVSGAPGFTYTGNQNLHFSAMRRYLTPPTAGRAEFAIIASTTPTYANNGRPAISAQSEVAGRLSIAFGSTNTWGIDATLNLIESGTTQLYQIGSAGLFSTPTLRLSQSNGQLLTGTGSVIDVTSTSCPTTCSLAAQFTLGGAERTLFGGTYNLSNLGNQLLSLSGSLMAVQSTFVAGSATPAPSPFLVSAGTSVILVNGSPFSGVGINADAGGRLASYTVVQESGVTGEPSLVVFARGTTTELESNAVGSIIGWTRWEGGRSTTQLTGQAAPGGFRDIPSPGGDTFVWGTPATNLPTSGTATYNLLGSTSVTTTDNRAPGSVDSASLAVAFGTVNRVGVDIGIRVAGNDYLISSVGGTANPSMELSTDTMRFGGSAQVGGTICSPSTCTGRLQGFLAGAGASHAGVAFTAPLMPGRSASAAGVVTFAKQP